MTQVAVMGDAHVGKTWWMLVACGQRPPLNVFRSQHIEAYDIGSATFVVAPGQILDCDLQEACAGSDALLVLYDASKSVRTARRWLRRVNRMLNGLARIPIIICRHGASAHDDAYTMEVGPGMHDESIVKALLREYPNAEHTSTTWNHACGIIDCANRLITRSRRDHPSPLSEADG
jgi:hypothetical protein